MADTRIDCGNDALQFIIEFPDLSHSANQHELNYQKYIEGIGFPNAPYMATARDEDPRIGYLHWSKALLGKGTFGEVHKAINTKTGELCAIKHLGNGGEDTSTGDRLHEAKLLSKLSHPNIIRYYDTFAFKGQVCIVMELAANDLLNHRDARKVGRCTPFLSLRCIQSISRQALEAIQYLHAEDVTHRDLKPANILVTDWERTTDLPTIKLADFGLARFGSEHATFCGTEGWLAPEVEKAYALYRKLREQRDRGMKTISRPSRYDNSVDIWALGKILKQLLEDIPQSRYVRGKQVSRPQESAVRLIRKMMQEIPGKRPTASQCLDDPWMVCTDTSGGLMATKRNRSPMTTSNAGQLYQKISRSTPAGADQGSTEILGDAMWPGEVSKSWSYSFTKARLSDQLANLSESGGKSKPWSSIHSEIDHLTIKPWAEGRFSIIGHCRDGNSIHGSLVSSNHATADASPVLTDLVTSRDTSAQMLAGQLLAALKMELYGNDDEVMRGEFDRLNITTLHIQQDPGSSVLLDASRDDRGLSGSFWNSSDAHAPGADDSNAIPINRLPARPLVEHPANLGNQPLPSHFNPAFQIHPRLVLTTEADDGQMLCDTAENYTQIDTHERSNCQNSTSDKTRTDNTPVGSNWSSSSAGVKGVTYPYHLDDVMAGLSNCYALPR